MKNTSNAVRAEKRGGLVDHKGQKRNGRSRPFDESARMGVLLNDVLNVVERRLGTLAKGIWLNPEQVCGPEYWGQLASDSVRGMVERVIVVLAHDDIVPLEVSTRVGRGGYLFRLR